ncbi:MAG: TMEM165/GDT1 family protein [Candidatus Odinarchaeota archaeon]
MEPVIILQSLFFAFGMIFLMELGDKTQLMSFTLATRYRSPLKVFGGVIAGLAAVTVMGVIAGLLLKETLDLTVLGPLIGLLFILIGIFVLVKALRSVGSEEEFICPIPEPRCPNHGDECLGKQKCELYIKEVLSKGAFKNSFVLSFAAELGDKTMLMTIGLTTQLDFTGVLVGAVLALAVVNFTGVFLGDKIAKIFPGKAMELVGAGLFILTGVLIMLI